MGATGERRAVPSQSGQSPTCFLCPFVLFVAILIENSLDERQGLAAVANAPALLRPERCGPGHDGPGLAAQRGPALRCRTAADREPPRSSANPPPRSREKCHLP